jgi:hypothetical protein
MDDYKVTIAFNGEVDVMVKSTDFESARIVARTIFKQRNPDVKEVSPYCIVIFPKKKK